MSKALSEKLKKVLPDLIFFQQTAYIKKRHIGESGRSISDIIEIAEIKKNRKFLDPRAQPEGSYKIGSVHSSFHASFHLFVRFLGISSLIFFKLSMVLGAHI